MNILKIIRYSIFCTLTATGYPAFANDQVAVLDGNIIRIPSLAVGDEIYINVNILYLGGVLFDVVDFESVTSDLRPAAAALNNTTLQIRTLEVNDETYIDLEFNYLGGVRLELENFTGPISELSFLEKSFQLVDPDSWDSSDSVYDYKTQMFIRDYGNKHIGDFPVMDVDRDGHKDLIIAAARNENGFVDKKVRLRWLRNTGTGSFEVGDDSVFPPTAERVLIRWQYVADFNNDGFDDYFAAATGYDAPPFVGEGNLLLLSKEGGGFNDASLSNEIFDYEGFTHGMAIGDVDNDGDIDIVTSDLLGGEVNPNGDVFVLVNDGIGNFIRSSTFSSSTTQTDISYQFLSMELVDLDDDNDLDFVAGGWLGKSGDTVFWNDGAGNYDLENSTSLPGFYDRNDLELYDTLAIKGIDLNYDGLNDLVLSKSQNYESRGVQFLLNNGDFTFSDVTQEYSPWRDDLNASSGAIPFWLEVIDINSDGYEDLRLKYDNEDGGHKPHSHIWLREKDGTFSEYSDSSLDSIGWFWATDYDTDGDIDLIVRRSIFEDDPGGDLTYKKYAWKILDNQILN